MSLLHSGQKKLEQPCGCTYLDTCCSLSRHILFHNTLTGEFIIHDLLHYKGHKGDGWNLHLALSFVSSPFPFLLFLIASFSFRCLSALWVQLCMPCDCDLCCPLIVCAKQLHNCPIPQSGAVRAIHAVCHITECRDLVPQVWYHACVYGVMWLPSHNPCQHRRSFLSAIVPCIVQWWNVCPSTFWWYIIFVFFKCSECWHRNQEQPEFG